MSTTEAGDEPRTRRSAANRGTGPRRRQRQTVGRVLAAAFVIGAVGFWVWAFSPWARSENPARLDDRAFAAWAQQRCAQAAAEIGGLPSARQAESPPQRAGQVDSGTDIVETLVGDLRAAAAGLAEITESDGPPDAALARDWLADWEVYLADRRAHSEKLRQAGADTPDRDLRFLLSDVTAGGVYTERMNGFARLNDMDACQIPGDV